MNNMDTRGRPATRHLAGHHKKRDPPPTPPKKRKPRKAGTNICPKLIAGKKAKNKDCSTRKRKRSGQERHNQQLRILQQNVAGLKTRKVELLKRLHDLKVDVCAIQEANFPIRKVNGELVHEIPVFKGWNIVAEGRKTGRKAGSHGQGRGGVAWLIREGVNYDEITSSLTGSNDKTTECCGIRVYQEKGGKVTGHLDLWNIYVPPVHESSKDDDRIQAFNTSKFPTTRENLFFGDVNCHGSWDDRKHPDKMGEMWEDWMQNNSFNYMNTQESYTRTDSKGTKSSPDISVIHNSWTGKYTWQPQYRKPGGSDHIPILITIKLNPANNRKNKKRTRTRGRRTAWAVDKANWTVFQQILETTLTAWPEESENWNVYKLSRELNGAIVEAAKQSIPQGKHHNPKPFWNKELTEAHKESNQARQDAHLSDAHAELYKAARLKVDEVTKTSKIESWRNYTNELDPRENPTKVWRTIAAMDGRKTKTRSGTSIKLGNKTATTDQEKADLFIKSYQQDSKIVKNKTADKPTVLAHRQAVKKLCDQCNNKYTGMCCPFSPTELDMALRKLKGKKSPGLDRITNDMLKKLPPKGKEILLQLYNLSWSNKQCPKEWKTAEIVTIPKPGKDHSLTTSHRPISLLSCISKLMERMVQARLQDFLERRNLLHPSQAGFRKARSTIEQITRLTQHLIDGLQCRERSVTVYVDFTKAYDKVWRDRLWAKMGWLGIPACVVKWVKSLLSDRHAMVRYNNAHSNKKRLDNGLPQGSVLAPLLWLIYVNDLPSALETTSTSTQLGTTETLFADDLSITATARTTQQCQAALQPTLDRLEKWCDENKVSISIDDTPKSKTVCCLYTRDPSENNGKLIPKLYLKGIQILHSTTPKFLGVTIDQQLNFREHAENTSTKVAKRNKILRALSGRSWGQKSNQLKNLHQTYTQSAVDYGLAAWGPMTAPSNIEKVARKEREAARIITGCVRDTPVDSLTREAGLTPLSSRVRLQATLQHERNTRLPSDVPAYKTAVHSVPLRLKKRGPEDPITKDKLMPPRELAWKTLCQSGLECHQKEKTTIHPNVEPWNWDIADMDIEFSTNLMGCMGKQDEQINIDNAAQTLLQDVSPEDILIFTDGSAEEGTKNGGAGAVVTMPSKEKVTLKRACGKVCSSFKAEMTAIELALEHVTQCMEHDCQIKPQKMWVITDSQSSIAALSSGPGNQFGDQGNRIWGLIMRIASQGIPIKFQWIPGHRQIEGNEEADKAAAEATKLPQDNVPIDFNTAKAAIKRYIREEDKADSSPTFHYKVTKNTPKKLKSNLTRKEEVLIHQLRCGKSPLAANCLYKYLGLSEEHGLCMMGCREKETVEHLLTCKVYDQQRWETLQNLDPISALNDCPDKVLAFLKKIGRLTAPDLGRRQ